MRLQINIPTQRIEVVKEKLKSHIHTFEREEWVPDYVGTVLIDPGSFRIIDEVIRKETKGRGTFEVINLAVIDDHDEQLM